MAILYRFFPPAILCVVLAALISACLEEPDRANPLDPLAPNFSDNGSLHGIVQDRSLAPLQGVVVNLIPGGLGAITSADGMYSFAAVPTGSYEISIARDGYESVSDSITVSLAADITRNYQLNGEPEIVSAAATTTHISRWWPEEDLYRINLLAHVVDIDGPVDIERVWIDVMGSISDTLTNGTLPGEYTGMLSGQDLGGATVHSFLGNEFIFSIVDRQGSTESQGGVFIARIIDEVPLAGSPQGLETVSTNTPTVTWAQLSQPFPFTQSVDVVRVDENVSTLVHTESDIASSDTTTVITTQLAPGEYYWTISIVDSFGNSSRSKQAGFQVQ